MIAVLTRFGHAFAGRDADAIMRLFAPGLVVVSFDDAVLRGRAELRHFLGRYAAGPTTYSWRWERYDVETTRSLAWLLAVGSETSAAAGRRHSRRYGMTILLERHASGWLLRHVRGSAL